MKTILQLNPCISILTLLSNKSARLFSDKSNNVSAHRSIHASETVNIVNNYHSKTNGCKPELISILKHTNCLTEVNSVFI